MAYNYPVPFRFNHSQRELRPNREIRKIYYYDKFLKLLRSRFRIKEFSYEANYKFFKLAYEKGSCAVYQPKIFGDINKYDSLLIFDYLIEQPTKTKNNLPLTIKPTKEEIDNSGGLLEDREYEIGKEVALYWTHTVNHITDAKIIKDIFCNQLVDIDEIEDNIRTSLQTPIIISYKNKNNNGTNNLINNVVNNNMIGYISDQDIGNIKPFQLSFDADNYINSLESLKTSKIDELLATFGFSNLGRGETQKKERLLTAEIKVESDGTNEALYDYIHGLEEFAKRAEDTFKLIFTPLISINGAFVDLITAHKYYKIKGCGGTTEELGNILNSYNNFSGNSVNFGRSGSNFNNDQIYDNINYGPDNEDRKDNLNWLKNIKLGNYSYIPYIPKTVNYTQAFFGNIWNFFMRGLGIYRINDIQENNINQNNINHIFDNINSNNYINRVNPPLFSFYRFVNYIATRNFNTLNNQYQHLTDIEEFQPILKQDIFNKLDDVFSESSKDYQSTIKYYFYLIQSYLKAGFSLSLPTLILSSLMASSYYFHMSDNSLDDVMKIYIRELDKMLPKEKSWSKLFGENYQQSIQEYEQEQLQNQGFKKILNSFLHYLFIPFTLSKVALKTIFYKNFLPKILSSGWIQEIGKYLLLFIIRNIIYVFSYRVSYSLLDFLNKDGSTIAKHYITTFNAALLTGFMSNQKDYRTGLKYALSTTLSHHLQTILYFANKLDRVEKNKIINLLNKWNDNILFSFPKDIIATFISKIIIDNIIDVILSPEEGPIKKATKFILKTAGKTIKFTYQSFKNIFDFILYKPIKNKINDISLSEGIELTSDYLGEHFDFILNFLQDCTLKFYESIKDFILMYNHPLLFIQKIKNENKNFLEESDYNIINQNPIDIAKEQKEIEEESKPLIMNFVNNLFQSQSYDEAAKKTLEPYIKQHEILFDSQSKIKTIQKDLSESINNINIELEEIKNLEEKKIDNSISPSEYKFQCYDYVKNKIDELLSIYIKEIGWGILKPNIHKLRNVIYDLLDYYYKLLILPVNDAHLQVNLKRIGTDIDFYFSEIINHYKDMKQKERKELIKKIEDIFKLYIDNEQSIYYFKGKYFSLNFEELKNKINSLLNFVRNKKINEMYSKVIKPTEKEKIKIIKLKKSEEFKKKFK